MPTYAASVNIQFIEHPLWQSSYQAGVERQEVKSKLNDLFRNWRLENVNIIKFIKLPVSIHINTLEIFVNSYFYPEHFL
jgi:hypothetical protein